LFLHYDPNINKPHHEYHNDKFLKSKNRIAKSQQQNASTLHWMANKRIGSFNGYASFFLFLVFILPGHLPWTHQLCKLIGQKKRPFHLQIGVNKETQANYSQRQTHPRWQRKHNIILRLLPLQNNHNQNRTGDVVNKPLIRRENSPYFRAINLKSDSGHENMLYEEQAKKYDVHQCSHYVDLVERC